MRSASLSLVLSKGEFGERVTMALAHLAEGFPEVYRYIHRAGAMDQGEVLRSELVSLVNTEKIRTCGYSVVGAAEGNVGVNIYYVLDAGELDGGLQEIESRITMHPQDRSWCLNFARSDSQPARNKLRALKQHQVHVCLVTTCAGGQDLTEDQVVEGVACLLLLSLAFPSVFSVTDNAVTFGCAGKTGIDGAARKRLAELCALKLCERQSEPAEHPEGALSRLRLDEWLTRYSPQHLGAALFDPERAKVPERERIPAALSWMDGEAACLHVKLNRDLFSLRLNISTPEAWAEQIRGYSRAFDMIEAVRWKQMLERAATSVREVTLENVKNDFLDAVGRTVQPLRLASVHIDELKDRCRRGATTAPTTDGDLEAALQNLQDSVRRIPSMLTLSLKMALWVVPAAVFGIGLIDHLYEGSRGTLFAGLYGVALVAVGVSWPLYAGAAAKRVAHRERSMAVDVMVSRQESIVAENAVGYLNDIVAALGQTLDDVERSLLQYEERLGRLSDRLTRATRDDIAGGLMVEPAVSRAAELEDTFKKLGIESKSWLVEAVNDGQFCVEELEESDTTESTREGLVTWCARRIADPARVKLPGLRELWEIREKHRGASGLAEAVSEIWRRAAPYTLVPPANEAVTFVSPRDLTGFLRNAIDNDRDIGQADIQVEPDFDVLACVRMGSLSGWDQP